MVPLLLVPGNSFCQTEASEAPNAPSSTAFRFEMDDKTLVVGSPDVVAFDLDLGYDDLTIPANLIHAIKKRKQTTSEPEVKFVVELTNRDRLTGKILNETIRVSFSAGEVILPFDQIRSIRSVTSAGMDAHFGTSGLVLQYDFETDSDQTVKNRAGDKHHCRLNGGTLGPTDLGSRGVLFKNNATLTVEHHQDLCPKTLSLSAWLNPKGNRQRYAFIMGKSTADKWTGGYAFVYMNDDPTNIYFYVNGYQQQVVKTAVPSNKWSYLTGTCDGKHVVLYLNGKEAARVDYPKGIPIRFDKSKFTIGGDTGGYPWTGETDEVTLHNHALSPAQVRNLFESSKERASSPE